MEIINNKAKYNYFIEDTIECGLCLNGNEVKSIRGGMCNIKDSYCRIINNEVFLINAHITNFDKSNKFDLLSPTRDRKLLLHKKEILKLKEKVDTKGYALIPIKIYTNKNKFKVSLGICKGKHLYDKRQTLKEKDMKRDAERDMRESY